MKTKRGYNLFLSVAAVLLCLTLFSAYLVSGLYAKYTYTNETNDSARIAKFVFDVSTTANEEVVLDQITKPGDKQELMFSVKNSKNGSKSEVAEKGTIATKYMGSMPLIIKLTDGTTEIAVLDAKTITESNPELSSESSEVTLQAAVETNKTYKLIVEWPSEENDIKYANAATCGKITFAVHGEQID